MSLVQSRGLSNLYFIIYVNEYSSRLQSVSCVLNLVCSTKTAEKDMHSCCLREPQNYNSLLDNR